MNDQNRQKRILLDEGKDQREQNAKQDLQQSLQKDLILPHFIKNQTKKVQTFTQSHHILEYQKQLQSIIKIDLRDLLKKFKADFKRKKILFNPEQFHSSFKIQKQQSTMNLQIVTYHVQISYFELTVSILNLEIPFIADQTVQILGSGNFGVVYLINVFGRDYACKNIFYREPKDNSNQSHSSQLSSILKEYCISKICSALKVGLSVEQALGFDIICYSNCAQFFLERGQIIQFNKNTKTELLSNLSLIHLIQLIHNDIKPQNLMFSTTYNRPVFIDFGISQFIKQPLGTLQKASFRGSYNYISDEMKELFIFKEIQQIDLYFNDLTGLLLTTNSLRNNSLFMFQRQSFIQNHNIFDLANSYIEFHSNAELSVSLRFKIGFVLLVYCLFTKNDFKEFSIEFILQKTPMKDMLYLELADILTEFIPNSYLNVFFMEWIKPFLQENKLQKHILFQIYKVKGYNNCLRKNRNKYDNFSKRFNENQNLYIRCSVFRQGQGFIDKLKIKQNAKTQWTQISQIILDYLKYMQSCEYYQRQEFTQQMYTTLLFIAKQRKIDISIQKSTFQTHYKNLCLIQNIFGYRALTQLRDFQIVKVVLSEFFYFGDLQKSLQLYQWINSQELFAEELLKWLKITFNIFCLILKMLPVRFLELLKTKIYQMQQIKVKIKDSTSPAPNEHLLYSQILIKIAKFYLRIYESDKIDSDVKFISQMVEIKEVENLAANYLNQSNNMRQESQIQMYIQQMNFLLADLQNNNLKIIQIGQKIISNQHYFKRLQTAYSFTKGFVQRKLALTYLKLEDVCSAKRLFQFHKSRKSNLSYPVKFQQINLQMTLNFMESKIKDTISNICELKKLTYQYNKPSEYMNAVIDLLQKTNQINLNAINCQIHKFLQFQLEDCFYKNQNKFTLKGKNQFYLYKIVYSFNLTKISHLKDPQINQKMINYRRLTIQLLLDKIRFNQSHGEQGQIERNRRQLQEFLSKIENIQQLPPEKYFLQIQTTFFSIHFKYHLQYVSEQSAKKIIQRVCAVISPNRCLIALDLWNKFVLIEINKLNYIDDNFISASRQFFKYLILGTFQQFFIYQKWYYIFFKYDRKLRPNYQQKFQFSIQLINKLSIYIINQNNSIPILTLKHICHQFLAINHQPDQLIIFSTKLRFYPTAKSPSLSVLLYLTYQVLTNQFQHLENFDHILSKIVINFPKSSSITQVFLQQKLHQLIANRLQFALNNSSNQSQQQNSPKIAIMNHLFTIDRIKKNYELYIKRHYRNPYSFDGDKQKFTKMLKKTMFNLKNQSQFYSQNFLNQVKEKIKNKQKKLILNKCQNLPYAHKNNEKKKSLKRNKRFVLNEFKIKISSLVKALHG